MSNAYPTSLCKYESLLKKHMNFVDPKLNELSVMSLTVFTIITAKK